MGADIQRATEHWLLEKLQDAEFAAQFLNAAGEDDDTKTYLTALMKATGLKFGVSAP